MKQTTKRKQAVAIDTRSIIRSTSSWYIWNTLHL